MIFDRRRFLGLAGLAGAGLLAGSRKAEPSGQVSASPRQTTSLSLLLWGSALYAFSKDGRRVEVAFLTEDPQVPGCTFVAHHPMLSFAAGGARIVPARTTVKLGPMGEIPRGAYRIAAGSVASGAGALVAVGLNGAAAACAGPAAAVASLAYVPTLKAHAASRIHAAWRDRFSTRFTFDYGELRAHAPLHGESELARWEVRGPGSGVFPFTDTLELTIPLAGNSVTFENLAGETLTVETDGDASRIEARLMAHPAETSATELRSGDQEPHFPALYAVFEPKPRPNERAELFFKDWCSASAAPPVAIHGGPSPGRYCTGAKIAL